ncbi:MAG TPA: hypothetical protein VJ184_12540 [Chryseolinea sp.]|nr:hypothetical protein [Chryseolinea sp.]
MKKLFLALCLCASAAAAFAQESSTDATKKTATEYKDDAKDMQAVAASELPAAVTAALQGQDYSGWTVGKAFKKEKDGKTIYKVELTNGSETKMVKLDADGNKLKAKDKEKSVQ